MNRTRLIGFSTIELLVVVAVLVVLAAIIFPTISSSKRSAKQTASVTRLRNQWIALSLYRTEYGGDGNYGTSPEMGLPEYQTFKMEVIDQSYPPCGKHPDFWVNMWLRCLYPAREEEDPNGLALFRKKTSQESTLYRDSWVLLIDDNCSDPNIKLKNKFHEKRAIGVLLGGQLKVRVATGDHLKPSWWAAPE